MNENGFGAEARADGRIDPDDSLLSSLVHAELEGRPLTETELLGNSHLLLLEFDPA